MMHVCDGQSGKSEKRGASNQLSIHAERKQANSNLGDGSTV